MSKPGKSDNGAGAPGSAGESQGAAERDPLRIVRPAPAEPAEPMELDLDLDEAAGDHRFGREDIADK